MQSDPARDAAPRSTVLVVDDDASAADNLCELLQLVGFETIVAYDGDTAVASALEHRPACAILDLHMPRVSGVVACTRLRGHPDTAGMKLVALTGSDQPQDREAAELAGFDHFLLKPVMVSALLHVLQPSAAG